MATFRLSGENKKVSVVRRTRPVHVRNTLNVFPYGETEESGNGLCLKSALYFRVLRLYVAMFSSVHVRSTLIGEKVFPVGKTEGFRNGLELNYA